MLNQCCIMLISINSYLIKIVFFYILWALPSLPCVHFFLKIMFKCKTVQIICVNEPSPGHEAAISDPVPVTSGPEQPIESLPEAEVLSFQGHQSPDRGEANNFCNDSRVPLALLFSLSRSHSHAHTHTTSPLISS